MSHQDNKQGIDAPALPPPYTLRYQIPDVGTYQHLRQASGLTPFPRAAAVVGLSGTFLGVTISSEHEIVGMGRVVGDGGLFFQIVDIAVLPAHQGKGLGKAIMQALTQGLAARISARAYVSLVADGEAHRLYAQYGFVPVAPKSQGMAMWVDPAR